MNLEHVFIPESKEVLQKIRKKKKDEVMLKWHRSQPERAPNGQSWNNLNKKINIVLEYNPKNK